MCLILLAVDAHQKYRLVIAANRDEFYKRPTAAAAFWSGNPDLLAGRDLCAGGTWIGITREGRIAALTNHRDPKWNKPDSPSRGKLVSGYLLGPEAPIRYLEKLSRDAARYNGYSILVGNREAIYWFSNREGKIRQLPSGIHGLSNHLLDTPWPKVEKGRQALGEILSMQSFSTEDIFRLLQDRTVAADEDLPDTGVGIEWERILAPIFIKSPTYGTRSSTVILLDRRGGVTFAERPFNSGYRELPTVRYDFSLEDEFPTAKDS